MSENSGWPNTPPPPQVHAALRLLAKSPSQRLDPLRARYRGEAHNLTGDYALGHAAADAGPTGLSRNSTFDVCLEALDEIIDRCEAAITTIKKRKGRARQFRFVGAVVTLISESALIGVIVGSDNKALQVSMAALTFLSALATLIATYIEGDVGNEQNATPLSQVSTAKAQAGSLHRSLRVLEHKINESETQPILDDLLEQTNQLAEGVSSTLDSI